MRDPLPHAFRAMAERATKRRRARGVALTLGPAGNRGSACSVSRPALDLVFSGRLGRAPAPAHRSYLVGAVGTTALTAPPRSAGDEPRGSAQATLEDVTLLERSRVDSRKA